MDWDPRGDRLAIAFASGSGAGEVAIYSTSCQPVITVRHIGNLSLGKLSKPTQALSFHQKYSGGSLLALLSDNQILTIPFLYTTGSN